MPSARSKRRQQQEQELEEMSNSTLREASRSHSPEDPPQNLLDMAELVRVLRNDRPARREVKPPQFDGQGDVELFLSQFRDVAISNQWTPEEYALHLRLSLTDKARDCSRAETREEIEHSLRAQFGLSVRQARDKIRTLQRGPRQSVHELGTEAKRLVRLAYPGLAQREQEDMAIEVFIQALDSRSLKRHFLATPAGSVNEAVEKVNEYFEASDSHSRTRVHAIDSESQPTQAAAPDPTVELLTSIQELLKRQEEQNGQIIKQVKQTPQTVRCFNCGGSHHLRDCPKPRSQAKQGNYNRPAVPQA